MFINQWRSEDALLLIVAQVVFVGFDHLLNHLTADGTGFTAGKLTVVTLVQLYADFSWCFSVT